jgi:DNA polymerase-3 subunit gamma/tau
MDKFVVSARKYRPQNFSSVVGQSHITTTLKNAIRNHQLAHAFLFCGPRGVGKTTCARILAKTINCENPSAEGEACNKCGTCISFNEGTSLNIHELDAASNNSVDDIRTLVEQVRFAPQAGKYKVYIIDEVHMLSSSAFNAFLKTLEEPPPYAIFILATTEKHKILPTILSRCQIFDFKRITIHDTIGHLKEICEKENIKAEQESLQVIAQKSEGCMRDALSILDKIVSFTNGEVTYQNSLEHLNILDADYYFRMMDAMLNQQLSDAMLLFDDINRKGFEGDLVLNGFSEFIRNLLICKDEKVASLLEVVESFREKYMSVAQKADLSYLISALNILNESEINYKSARNKKLHVEIALIKLCYMRQALELTSAGDGIHKKKIIDTARPVAFRAIVPIEFTPDRRAIKTPKQSEEKKENAKLLIDPALHGDDIKAADQPADSPYTMNGQQTVGTLSKIREQFASRRQNKVDKEFIPLDEQKLKELWQQYTALLRQNKSSATQSFEFATLIITDSSTFEIATNNNLEQKFIEQEKRNLSEFLQKAFSNKRLNFTVTTRENGMVSPLQPQAYTKRDQFQKIIEQYPLVKELKERLNLELDY